MRRAPWLIRVASHPQHGGGHLARCLALAPALAAEVPVLFVLDSGADAAAARIRTLGFEAVFEKDAPAGALQGTLLDGYAFAPGTAEGFAARGPLAVMDDFLTATPAADLVINAACQLDGDMIRGARALLGPQYALVASRFVQPADVSATIERVVVTFGLLDPDNVTAVAVDALGILGREGFQPQVDIVLAAQSPHRAAVTALAEALGPRARIILDAPDMAEVLAGAGLVLGAGGVSLYERAAMGIPSITTSIIENQDLFVAGAGKAGITVDAGPAAALDAVTLAAAVRDLAGDAERSRAMSRRCQAVVDGRGANRIAAVLKSLRTGVHRDTVTHREAAS